MNPTPQAPGTARGRLWAALPPVLAVLAVVLALQLVGMRSTAFGANPGQEPYPIMPRLWLPLVIREYPPLPTPTVAPTPTPVGGPPTVHILDNYSHYTDTSGYLHVVGEIINNTTGDVSYVEITLNFLDSEGRLLGIYYDYLYFPFLPRQVTTCFHLSTTPPSGWASYGFEVSYSTYGSPLPTFTPVDDYAQNLGTSYRILGFIRNDSGYAAAGVGISGILYSTAGKVVGCGDTFASTRNLDPGAQSSFQMVFASRGHYEDVLAYRLQSSGVTATVASTDDTTLPADRPSQGLLEP